MMAQGAVRRKRLLPIRQKELSRADLRGRCTGVRHAVAALVVRPEEYEALAYGLMCRDPGDDTVWA
jgi:hypothetical protein